MQVRKLGPDGPTVSCIGLGTMLLSISGRPPEDQGIRVIQAALDHGISLIDTADCYCYDHNDFHHNEKLVLKALKGRRDQVTIMTKVGCRRPGGAWTIDARPEYLTEAAHNCLKSLGVDTIDLLALNSPDSRVPFAESVGALARLKEQGKIRHVGLCNAQVSHIEEARAIVPIASRTRGSRMPRSFSSRTMRRRRSGSFMSLHSWKRETPAREGVERGLVGQVRMERRDRDHARLDGDVIAVGLSGGNGFGPRDPEVGPSRGVETLDHRRAVGAGALARDLDAAGSSPG